MTTPRDVLTAAEIESELRRLSDELGAETDTLADRAREAGVAEVDYKVAHAKAYLRASGPVNGREATATVETESQFMARKVADARLSASTERLRTIRAQLDALRTIAANVRAQT